MLTLDRRTCEIADDYAGKGIERDGQKIRTITVRLDKIELEERELNALLGEPHAYRSLYNISGDRVTPFLRCFKALEFDKALEGVYVALTYGLDEHEMVFTDCKLSKLKLALLEGGKTSMSCKVTITPTLDDTLAELFEQFGTSIECEIRAEVPTAQQDLPLNTHGVGEQPATKRAGRKPFHTMSSRTSKSSSATVPTAVKAKRGRRAKASERRTVQ